MDSNTPLSYPTSPKMEVSTTSKYFPILPKPPPEAVDPPLPAAAAGGTMLVQEPPTLIGAGTTEPVLVAAKPPRKKAQARPKKAQSTAGKGGRGAEEQDEPKKSTKKRAAAAIEDGVQQPKKKRQTGKKAAKPAAEGIDVDPQAVIEQQGGQLIATNKEAVAKAPTIKKVQVAGDEQLQLPKTEAAEERNILEQQDGQETTTAAKNKVATKTPMMKKPPMTGEEQRQQGEPPKKKRQYNKKPKPVTGDTSAETTVMGTLDGHHQLVTGCTPGANGSVIEGQPTTANVTVEEQKPQVLETQALKATTAKAKQKKKPTATKAPKTKKPPQPPDGDEQQQQKPPPKKKRQYVKKPKSSTAKDIENLSLQQDGSQQPDTKSALEIFAAGVVVDGQQLQLGDVVEQQQEGKGTDTKTKKKAVTRTQKKKIPPASGDEEQQPPKKRQYRKKPKSDTVGNVGNLPPEQNDEHQQAHDENEKVITASTIETHRSVESQDTTEVDGQQLQHYDVLKSVGEAKFEISLLVQGIEQVGDGQHGRPGVNTQGPVTAPITADGDKQLDQEPVQPNAAKDNAVGPSQPDLEQPIEATESDQQDTYSTTQERNMLDASASPTLDSQSALERYYRPLMPKAGPGDATDTTGGAVEARREFKYRWMPPAALSNHWARAQTELLATQAVQLSGMGQNYGGLDTLQVGSTPKQINTVNSGAMKMQLETSIELGEGGVQGLDKDPAQVIEEMGICVRVGDSKGLGTLMRHRPDIFKQQALSLWMLSSIWGYNGIGQVILNTGSVHINSSCERKSHTALHRAATYGNDAVVSFLISNGADCNVLSGEGMAAVHYAVVHGHSLVVKAMLEHDRSIANTLTTGGKAPLHMATEWAIVLMLVKAGADLGLKDGAGCTALHYAVKSGDRRSALVLLRNGRRKGLLGVTDKEGKTAKEYVPEGEERLWEGIFEGKVERWYQVKGTTEGV